MTLFLFFFSSLLCSQIWLISLVDEHQCGYITGLKKIKNPSLLCQWCAGMLLVWELLGGMKCTSWFFFSLIFKKVILLVRLAKMEVVPLLSCITMKATHHESHSPLP